MELLVSVRSRAEVGAALAGGADIIDAKEPDQGPLGAVSVPVLVQILDEVPAGHPVSVALGDLETSQRVAAAIAALPLRTRSAPIYVKLGFAGVTEPDQVEELIDGAVAASSQAAASPRVVAVAYADAARAGTLSPDSIRRVAARSGAAGILLDTYIKDGRGLPRWVEPTALARWVAGARAAGLLTALAGGLGLGDLDLVSAAGADVIGIRGAACHGGRGGRVDADRVRALRLRLNCGSVSVQVGHTSSP
jgi:uncharacterized protein (UPF0264 family)